MFTTDGRILALHLKVLEDDRKFFPKYNVSLVLTDDTMKKYPQIAGPDRAGDQEADQRRCCSSSTREIDVSGDEPADVAFQWLKKEGFVTD